MRLVCWAIAIVSLPLAACGGSTEASAGRAPRAALPPAAAAVPFDGHILVDQFGYRPHDKKVAVIRTPHVGYDAAAVFAPGAVYEVRRANDGAVVFSGAIRDWEFGKTEASSGDSGWWFDFSAVDAPGQYFITDVQRKVRSATFRIDENVYKDILKAAVRTYFYQRSGIAKQPPQAEACWTDEPAYLGPDQDLAAHDITDPDNKAKFKNVFGGWHDAGDTNKYVTFAAQPVHQLLTAYQETPRAFTDDFGIPESHNGIPDLLDEVKWETDWLKRMQNADGSVALKVGETVYAKAAPPSSDKNTRYYIPTCTSSTIATAGMLAHAAYVFDGFPPLSKEALDLKYRAIAAWKNYAKTPVKQTSCDSGVVHAGNADWPVETQQAAAVVAAVYLYAMTDDAEYDQYVKEHYKDTKPYHDFGWSRYNPEQGEALLFYTGLKHADATTREAIRADKLADMQNGHHVYGFDAADDLYRAYMHDEQYHWGSNMPRAGYGNTNLDAANLETDPAKAVGYQDRALEILHYFHGVNPFAMVYLSNMYAYGATQSANEIFHTWYAAKTRWSDALTSECGPAPGYVPGGPNVGAAQSGVPSRLAPPTGQPAQKSYKDWNAASPDSSWAITEPAIYYESGYVKMLAKFVP